MNLTGWEVNCRDNKQIKLVVFNGHFATSQAHVDHYMSFTNMRTNHRVARLAAVELAKPFMNSAPVDTIVCLEYTQVIGSFLAQELSMRGTRGINENSDIAIITPDINSNSQLVFSNELQGLVRDKRILVLLSSVSTGRSLNRALECIAYYGGHLTGIASLFSAVYSVGNVRINSLFSPKDVPNYHSYQSVECPYCKAGRKLDGFISISGYTRI